MRWFIIILLLVLFAVAAAGVFIIINGTDKTWTMLAGQPDQGPLDLGTDLTRSSKPNDALVCSTGLCDGLKIDLVLPVYDLTPDALVAKIENAFRTSGIAFERVDDGSDPARVRFVTRTPGLGFPDTNWFQVVPMQDGSTGLIAYAKAQLGYSDNGNNLARLKRLTAGLSAQD